VNAYKYRPGDVLEQQQPNGAWLAYTYVTPVKHASCVSAVYTDNYAGVPGKFRIVRDDGSVALS
jgi:hypothetical protein